MKILLTNDDGIDSPAFPLLLAVLCGAGHDCSVVAPDKNSSAIAAALTLYAPLRAVPYLFPDFPNVPAYAVSGTPVDCVRLALGNLVSAPDLVLSGVNLGPNLGSDTLYSGTCAAAQEAAVRGIPAAALSAGTHAPQCLDAAASFALQAIEMLQTNPPPEDAYYNINIPDAPQGEWKGVKQSGLAVVRHPNEYVHCTDPRGRDYYWAPGNFNIHDACQDRGNTDIRWLREGWVTVTVMGWRNNVQCTTHNAQ
ncbi:MAG: 5'/3'-nucleotidase SurE [Clostridiales bacterium]|nr:5'/3'-nucleotidase SurE [Clostridiales bacterium]